MKYLITICLVLGLFTFSSAQIANACNIEKVNDPSGIETWNADAGNPHVKPNPYYLGGILVEAGKTLIIENLALKFQCHNTRRIIVKPGGKLIINNVTIESEYVTNTSTIPTKDHWARFEGILVEGADSTHPQMNYYRTYYDPTDPNFVNFSGYNPAHGILIMQNSTIKRVLRYRINPTSSWSGGNAIESINGGVIELFNNRFENNSRDIYINDFNREPQSINTPNQFNIINCDFIKEPDSDLAITFNDYPSLRTYIWLENVRSVQIEGCHFENNFGIMDSDSRKEGIIVLDASFYLQKSGFARSQNGLDANMDRWGNTTSCPTYNLPFARVNVFKNLTYGITTCDNSPLSFSCPSPAGVGNNKVGISDCVFLDCKNGISLESKNAYYKSQHHITISRSLYLLHNSSLLGKLNDFKFISILDCKNVIITENAADISVEYETDVEGNALNGSMLSGRIIHIDKAEDPDVTEVYRNNIDIEYAGITYNGLTCSGNRDKTYPTDGIFLGVRDNSGNGPHNLRFGCINFENLSKPIIIKPKAYLPTQGNGSSESDHSKSAELNFNNCDKPYIFWNRNMHHSGKSFKVNYDDSNPDPDGDLDYVEEIVADSSTCDSIGCIKWPIRYIDAEVSINEHKFKTNRIVFNPANNSIISHNNSAITGYKIIDLNGRIIEQANALAITNNTIVLESNYKNGIYIVQITTANAEVYSEKIHVFKQ